MELTLAEPAQVTSQESPGAHGGWSVDGLDIAALRTELDSLQVELEQLSEQLGVAVVDGDEARSALLEARIDALTVHRKGLIAEIAECEATAVASSERARRREEAAKRERRRRELAAAQVELYRGMSAMLEHRGRLAQLVQELERLRLAPPVEQGRLDGLRLRLEQAGFAFDRLWDELAASEDPARLQAAAVHYELLAASAPEPAAASESPGRSTHPPSDESPPAEAPEQVASGVHEDLARLDELEQRLRRMLNTFDGRGYQQAAVKEIHRQLAQIEAERKRLESAAVKEAEPQSSFFPGFKMPRRARM